MWEDTFRNRMEKFSSDFPASPDDVAVSIKIRVISGCFHREHSPHAYKIIDNYLQNIADENIGFIFVEHENGPEILAYLTLASSLVILSGNVIELITTIIKARSESVKKGDHPREPVELIIRRVEKPNQVIEEKVLRIDYKDLISSEDIEKRLKVAAKKLLSDGEKKKRRKK